jgi:hypothetical protein
MDPCQELWKQADIHHKYRSKKNCEPAQAAPADAKWSSSCENHIMFLVDVLKKRQNKRLDSKSRVHPPGEKPQKNAAYEWWRKLHKNGMVSNG